MLYIILSVIIVILLYIVFNLNRKYEKIEELLDESYIELEKYENHIQLFSDNLTLIDNKLKEIDKKGSFESDDETGYVFKSIKLILSKLQEFNVNG